MPFFATILQNQTSLVEKRKRFLRKRKRFLTFGKEESWPETVTLKSKTLKQQQSDQLKISHRPNVHRTFC